MDEEGVDARVGERHCQETHAEIWGRAVGADKELVVATVLVC